MYVYYYEGDDRLFMPVKNISIVVQEINTILPKIYKLISITEIFCHYTFTKIMYIQNCNKVYTEECINSDISET